MIHLHATNHYDHEKEGYRVIYPSTDYKIKGTQREQKTLSKRHVSAGFTAEASCVCVYIQKSDVAPLNFYSGVIKHQRNRRNDKKRT